MELAATLATPRASATGGQAVTLGVKPEGAGGYVLIVGAAARRLARRNGTAGRLRRARRVRPLAGSQTGAMVIKGNGKTRIYSVICVSAAPAPLAAPLAENLASLRTMRASVATQPASPMFREAGRRHVLGAINRSMEEVAALLDVVGRESAGQGSAHAR